MPVRFTTADYLMGVLRDSILGLVRRRERDLSARQLGVFLSCYLEDEEQTVRGLAAKLNVSKPAISRALDRLAEFNLIRRKIDPIDRRSVLVQRTSVGMDFMRNLKKILRESASATNVKFTPIAQGMRVGGGLQVLD